MEKYRHRQQAGRVLANELKDLADSSYVLILALPRGGVPVAYEIATALHVPLDVFIVRKLGVPGHVELAMGALAMGNIYEFNDKIIRQLNITQEEMNAVIAKEEQELKRRELAYRDNLPFPTIKGKTVVLVDDGIATGASMRAAIKALRKLEPAKLIVAVPVADHQLCEEIKHLVDRIVCPLRPTHFYAVGAWYDDFSQTEDEEVFNLLQAARKHILST